MDRRSGHLLVLFSILLVMLLAFAGLVIDQGRMHSAHREAQNAADAAAMAASLAKYRGLDNAAALAEANLMRTQNSPYSSPLTLNNGLVNSLNIPPLAGPHQGDADYCEVYVSIPVDTWFIQIAGAAPNYVTAARAVAGQELPSQEEGVIVLDPQAISGLSVSGAVNANGSVTPTIVEVNGSVLVNSLGSGYNQWGQWASTWPSGIAKNDNGNTGGNTYPAIKTQTTNQTPAPSIEAKHIIAAGGTSSTDSAVFKYYGDPDYPNGKKIFTGGTNMLFPDPLRGFPVPQPGVDARVDVTVRDQLGDATPDGNVSFGTGDVETLQPGVYHDIRITGSANVTFAPGIYIISPSQPNDGLVINGSPTITGLDVMFYMTGNNYLTNNQPPGYWDALDDSTNNQLDGPLPLTWSAPTASTVWNTQQGQKTQAPGTDPFNGNVRFATIDINIGDGILNLRGLDAAGGAFDNMLFFARRRNNQTIRIAGNAGNSTIILEGVVYAKWSQMDISGGGNWTAQFVVGSLKASGGANINIQGFGQSFGLVKQLFLVE